MSVADNDPRPPYIQVADELREAMASGSLTPGQRLPSVRKLAEDFGVAPMTVQNALRLLREEGRIQTTGNRGNFVLATDTERDANPADLGTRVERLASEMSRLADRVAKLEARDG